VRAAPRPRRRRAEEANAASEYLPTVMAALPSTPKPLPCRAAKHRECRAHPPSVRHRQVSMRWRLGVHRCRCRGWWSADRCAQQTQSPAGLVHLHDLITIRPPKHRSVNRRVWARFVRSAIKTKRVTLSTDAPLRVRAGISGGIEVRSVDARGRARAQAGASPPSARGWRLAPRSDPQTRQ
jgi:hypothetical protein